MSISPPAGALGSQILMRDAQGRPVALTDSGRAWLAGHVLDWGRKLRPGEAIGFAFPLDEMFALKPGAEYAVLVVLPGKDAAASALASPPVKITAPLPRNAPGQTGPPTARHERGRGSWRWRRNPRRRWCSMTWLTATRIHRIFTCGWRISRTARFGLGRLASEARAMRKPFWFAKAMARRYMPLRTSRLRGRGWGFTWEGILYPGGFTANDGHPRSQFADCDWPLSSVYHLRPGREYDSCVPSL